MKSNLVEFINRVLKKREREREREREKQRESMRCFLNEHTNKKD